MPLAIGQVLQNRYRIVKLLGQGGFGAVYRAWDLNLERAYALKENLEITPEAQRQFEREARLLSNLEHPNLPRIQDYFSIPQQGQYLVMDYVDGDDLLAILKNFSGGAPASATPGTFSAGYGLPQDKVLNWILQVSSALEYLHSQNPAIIHRDIKPANIRITPQGKAVLVDFGIAKLYDPNSVTTLGARAATDGYSPPEQYGRGITDAQSDVYALGATLYHLLTGVLPPSAMEIVASLEPPPLPATQLNPQVLPAISAAIGKAMQLSRTARTGSVSEFSSTIRSGMTAPRLNAAPPPPAPRVSPSVPQVVQNPAVILTASGLQTANYVNLNKGQISNFAFSADGSMAAAATPTSILLYDLRNRAEIREAADSSGVNSLAFSPDGQLLAAGSRDGALFLFRISDGLLIHRWAGHKASIASVVFSPGNLKLATAASDSTIRIWRVSDRALENNLNGHKDGVLSLAFSPDGQILASGSWDETIRLWRAQDGGAMSVLKGHTKPIVCLCFSPDGRTLVSASNDETLRLWNIANRDLFRTLKDQKDYVLTTAFSPDGQIMASASYNKSIQVWRVKDWSLQHTLTGSSRILKIGFSPDGRQLITGAEDGTLRVWAVQP